MTTPWWTRLKYSVNTIFAQLVAAIGPERVVETAHALGIRSPLDPFCSITLGSVRVNPLEMTNAYATLANRGTRLWATPLLQVKTPSGGDRPRRRAPAHDGARTNDADLVTYALQGVMTSGGTGASANLGVWPAAGKTGTAKKTTDAWFCGYTVQIVACVWVGYPEGGIPMENIEGLRRGLRRHDPGEDLAHFMLSAMQGLDPTPFPTPSFDGNGGTAPTPAPFALPSLEPCPTDSLSPSPTSSSVPCIPVSPSRRALAVARPRADVDTVAHPDRRSPRPTRAEPTPTPKEAPPWILRPALAGDSGFGRRSRARVERASSPSRRSHAPVWSAPRTSRSRTRPAPASTRGRRDPRAGTPGPRSSRIPRRRPRPRSGVAFDRSPRGRSRVVAAGVLADVRQRLLDDAEGERLQVVRDRPREPSR